MESPQDTQPAKAHKAGRLALHGVVVAAAVAMGYQLNSHESAAQPLVANAPANVVTIQSFPNAPGSASHSADLPASVTDVDEAKAAADTLDTAVERKTEPTETASEPVAPQPLSEASTPIDTADQNMLVAVPLPELMPVGNPLDGDHGSDETFELEYVASLSPSGESLPEGLETLESGTLTRLIWHAGESLYGSSIPTPVLVAQGEEDGPTLCLTAAVHGDEINGIETVRRVMYSINAEKLKGRVIGVPIVNLQAFERHSRYLPDRRDLNRFFPGNPTGSSASRIAHSLFDSVIVHCNALVDLHTGSFHRTNLPQLRANLDVPEVVELTQGFGATVILHSEGGAGTLRAAATRAGIPAVTLEAGEPLRIDGRSVKHSEKALFTLMNTMGMYKRPSLWGNPEPTYYSSMWIRADKGGMLMADAKLGKRVRKGDVLGTVVDPITNDKQELAAPADGRLIGMALDQFVMPGYAAFHLGIEAPSLDELESAPGEPDYDHSVAQLDSERERDDSE